MSYQIAPRKHKVINFTVSLLKYLVMKILNGLELVEFVKDRQAKQVRGLKQAHGIHPKLAIVHIKDDPVIDTYVNLKRQYGQDIAVDVDIHKIPQSSASELINQLNNDSSVHGIIVQLPLEDVSQTTEILNLVAPEKDVDALGENATLDPATPMAILWLLAGYNVELKGKEVLLIGKGRLVGAPLERMLKNSGINVAVADRSTEDLSQKTMNADVIITATGSPAILYPEMVKHKAVIVDAGVASEDGKTVGDVAPEMYERDDITITPQKGGVGPLTVCALFDNVLRAARSQIKDNE